MSGFEFERENRFDCPVSFVPLSPSATALRVLSVSPHRHNFYQKNIKYIGYVEMVLDTARKLTCSNEGSGQRRYNTQIVPYI
jgi:hypothetical protein